MKKIIEFIPVPKENLQNLVISLFVVVFFIGAALIPNYLAKTRLEKKISEVRYNLDKQNSLLPLYQTLLKASSGGSSVLVAPATVRLERAGLEAALKKLQGILDKSQMTGIAVLPDLGSVSKDVNFSAVNMSFRGSFENFRTVLLDLGALPYLERIEELSIKQETKDLAFKIKIILAMS